MAWGTSYTFRVPTNRTEPVVGDVLLILYGESTDNSRGATAVWNGTKWAEIGKDITVNSVNYESGYAVISAGIAAVGIYAYKATYIPSPY